MKIKEITELADKDLREKLGQAEEAYKQMRLNHQISPLENSAQIKLARRDIARMKTVLRERELNK